MNMDHRQNGISSEVKKRHKFEIAVSEKFDLLRSKPECFKKTYKEFHEVYLKNYPYSIIYLIDTKENCVIIFSVFHHKEIPGSNTGNSLLQSTGG
jgi:plasmid stabilization system protein ParE